MSGVKVWEDIFVLNLVLLFEKPKFRFLSWKTVSSEMLEMWKMKNVTLFSLDEQQSNGPFYLLLSDRFTTFAPGIYAIAPNRQIYTKLCSWNLGQMIQSCVHLLCLVCKKNWFTCYQREGKQERGEEKGWEIWPQHLRSHKMFQIIFVCCFFSRQIFRGTPSQKTLFTRPW